MKKRILAIILAVMMLVSVIPMSMAAAAEELTLAEKYPGVDTTLTAQPSATSQYPNNHDPEIIWAPDKNGEYWYWDFCTGSYDVRISKDLTHWTSKTSPFSGNKPPVDDGTSFYSNYWAPFVLDNTEKDGYYYLYYCHSQLHLRTSNLGVYRIKKEDGLDGKWEFVRVLIKSRSYDASGNPIYGFNAIDPMVTYDNEGRLWMVYGSFFQGIALLELDANDPTRIKGMADGETMTATQADNTPEHPVYTLVRRDEREYVEDDGNVCGVEGPTIVYNPDTQYYYLCVSYDLLDNLYNTRVGRSKTITGPYLDYNGNNLIHYDTLDSPTRGEAGTKIIAPYSYDNDNHSGWVGTGHCTFFKAQDGQYYIGHNSRLGNANGTALLNVRRVIWSDDGWPMASSENTGGENIANLATPVQLDMSGSTGVSWEIIRLERNVMGKWDGSQQAKSTKLIFNPDGSINNGGTWAFSNPSDEKKTADVTINLNNGVGDIKGKVYFGWDNENWKEALLFVGMTNEGTVYWGKRGLTAEETYANALEKLQTIITNNATINKKINLATQIDGYPLVWESSEPEWLGADGIVVKKPAEGEASKEVKLTATLDGKDTAQFTVYVRAEGDILLAHYTFDDPENLMASSTGTNDLTNYGATAAEGLFGGAARLSNASSSNRNYMQLPAGLTCESELTVSAWVNMTSATSWARIFDIGGGEAHGMFLTVRDGSRMTRYDVCVNGNSDVITTSALPTNTWTHVAISYGPDIAKLYINGNLIGSMDMEDKDPTTVDGKASYLGKSQYAADRYFNGYYDEVYLYNVQLEDSQVKELAKITGEAAATLDKANLGSIIANNQTITGDITLPETGDFGTPIVWTSSDDTILTAEGKLLRKPGVEDANFTVQLTATIDDKSATFNFTVPYTGLIAHYEFDDAENLMKDTSGRGNDLRNFGATAAEGQIGGAAYLSGEDAYMQFPAGMTKTDILTLAMWYKVETNTEWARIFDIGGGQGNTFYLTNNDLTNHDSNPETPNYLHLDLNVNNSYNHLRTTPAAEGEWAHVAAVVDGTNYYLYVNGELAGTQTLGTRKLSSLNGNNAFLGKSQYSDPYFNGSYDDVRFYNIALSAEEIAALAASSTPTEFGAAADKSAYVVNEDITITATTPADVEKVVLYNESGKGITRKSTECFEANGVKTWTIVTSLGTKGDREISVKAIADGETADIATVAVKIVKEAIPEIDPTVAPAIIGDITAPEKASVGEQFTVTLKTSKAVSKIGIFNINGAGVSCSKKFEVVEDGINWTITMAVSSKGTERPFTVKVSDGGEWAESTGSFAVTITK